jgi:hypothetical protein
MYAVVIPITFFFGDDTEAPQPWGLLCNPVMKTKRKMISFFFRFSKKWSTGGMKLTGKTEVIGKKTYPSVTLSTTNPTWTDKGSNPGLRGERPAPNRLNHGTAISLSRYSSVSLYVQLHVNPVNIFTLHFLKACSNILLTPAPSRPFRISD